MEIRADVLLVSLKLENMTSRFLSKLIGIEEDYSLTFSFGNKGSALSFSQKIHLLIDIGALDKDAKKKFFTFMEIRNQFMHNDLATNYEQCFSFIKEKKNFVLSFFESENSLTEEEHLKLSVRELSNEVLKLTIQLINKIQVKIASETEGRVKGRLLDVLSETMQNNKESLISNYQNQDAKTYSNIEVVKIINEFYIGSMLDTLKRISDELDNRTK